MNVILVHGILGFRKKLGFAYFRGVEKHFTNQGLTVLVPELDPLRGVEFRGDQLCEMINAAFASGELRPGEKTHILAHSMGGLDSRYMLSPASGKKLREPVHSLTTISTPHRGSLIADIVDNPRELFSLAQLPLARGGNPLIAALPALGISIDGLRDLRRVSCSDFSARYVDHPDVSYFSVAGMGRQGLLKTASVFLAQHTYIRWKTGEENDGLVTVSSARWGRFDPSNWFADHAEEIGYNLDRVWSPPGPPYLAKYDQMIANVRAI